MGDFKSKVPEAKCLPRTVRNIYVTQIKSEKGLNKERRYKLWKEFVEDKD